MGLFVKIAGAPGYAFGFIVFLLLALMALLLLLVLNRYRAADLVAEVSAR